MSVVPLPGSSAPLRSAVSNAPHLPTAPRPAAPGMGAVARRLLSSTAETYLATHARGVFKMAFIGVGPTELRILLAAGALALINSPTVDFLGLGQVRLWDIGGLVGAIGMAMTFIVSSAKNVRALYVEETRR